MRYLGRISGSGQLTCKGEDVARATYDFDGFFNAPARVTSSGDIQLSATALEGIFGRRDVQLLTDDGRRLDLKFSEKSLPSASEIAHVDVTGDLPTTPQGWRR